ncbi:MAG TPA: hypothetical protein VE732_06210 [Nitrososphaera sp.]|nr:hypothetical protein [Nitrososphaera sp.]
MKSLILTWLLLIVGIGYGIESHSTYSANPQAKSENSLTPADEDDIREAVFRYQFDHNASAQQQNAKVYFLSLGKAKDPSDLFMLRFRGHKPSVKKGSHAGGKGEVIDNKTGERGLIFYATSIKQIDENEVEVEGGYYEAGLSSSGNTYTVKRKENKWVVTKDKLRWIS